ncbi:leucine-rich repeat domain-containing protein [Mucilaginibacter aquariorum]|uniref:Leucine-rich repeat domain-containing protein n=1 Tax=Mucilaginibacter aquariorum TaxID=2967225 RepID=A0ABT1SXU2_9SPHI|nr:leucine-rich repeat domain-containing protein [Mucilaginibacter aquariorum]MCQ6957087.1 leucine-rich repeat domain-containing protein [Mucilaginibacter aquariorum]
MKIPLNASKIDLSNQNLKEIPQEIFQCTYLQKLNLSNNQIRVVPKEISKLSHLRNLDLSGNNIQVLYGKLFELKKLEILILNRNKLKNIPEMIKGLSKLRKLGLAFNDLKILPQNIGELQNLVSINVSNNKLTSYPEQLFNLKGLRQLWLGANRFQTFPFNRIASEYPHLNSVYCFNRIASDDEHLDSDYLSLQNIKGNCLKALKMITNINQSKLTLEEAPTSKEYRAPVNNKKNVFVSYSHKDKSYMQEVVITLKQLEYLGIENRVWVDTDLQPGDKMFKTIMGGLDKSGVAINIISRDYLASDFIQKYELPAVLKKNEDEGMLVLNLIVRKCLYSDSQLKDFVAINDPKEPMQGLRDSEQELIYDRLAQRLKKHFTEIA